MTDRVIEIELAAVLTRAADAFSALALGLERAVTQIDTTTAFDTGEPGLARAAFAAASLARICHHARDAAITGYLGTRPPAHELESETDPVLEPLPGGRLARRRSGPGAA